ncbi:hypothetical protein N7519_009201 [Penicillium mononematosum]|uniref:uncharacterized protein n=1 Tax=Penicillium mononematosum TaxID=268346 RepID=UPI002546C82F|nr:uncharacterized protein N7519_009201 [Penicillium mononematosum]KAJ6178740.1 hypothetical protein N7519_009201 [Penicillium mononematosum]
MPTARPQWRFGAAIECHFDVNGRLPPRQAPSSPVSGNGFDGPQELVSTYPFQNAYHAQRPQSHVHHQRTEFANKQDALGCELNSLGEVTRLLTSTSKKIYKACRK